MIKINSLFLFCASLICFSSFSQLSSFQISPDIDTVNYAELLVNEQNETSILGNGHLQKGRFYLIDVKNEQGSYSGFKFWTDPLMLILYATKAVYFKNRVTAIHYPHGLQQTGTFYGLNIFNFDYSTEQAWMKVDHNFGYRFEADFDIDTLNNIYSILNPRITSSSDLPNKFHTFFLDSLGATVWKKGYELVDTTFAEYWLTVKEVVSHPEGFFYTLGQFGTENFLDSQPDEEFIFKTDNLGNPLAWKRIINHQLTEIHVDAFGGIYLLGKTQEEYTFTENEENTVLVKLDKDLNEIWTKVYHAESFEFSRVTMNVADDGNVYLGYSTFGAFPVILAKLNPAGDILWEKGYPFYEPEIDVMPNGSLLMLTQQHFDADNNLFPQTIIAKTDSLGDFENCDIFPACLDATIIQTEFADFQVDTFTIDDLDFIDVFVEPIDFGFTDFCNIPPPPNPEFDFPDTICINSCETSFETYNYFAHGIEWKLESQDVNVVLQDSLNFDYCFSEAGDYVLTQTVWFLGCAYSFEKNVFVKDLDISITPDFVLCNDFPVELSVESSVPLSEYMWNSGATTSTIEIEEIGEYFIEVSDGICMDLDTINFVKLADESCPLNLTIPNVFTPDGDGLNDTFGPVDGEYYEVKRIIIFNRWGQKIYDGKNAWDGNIGNKPCPSDVFVYRMEYLNLLNDEVEEMIGEVTLVR